MAFDGDDASRDQRRFDVVDHGQPREKRKTLEDDGDTRNLSGEWPAVPQYGAGRWLGEACQNSEQGRLAGARRAKQCDDLPRGDVDVRRSDDLNAIAVRLGKVLLNCASLDDRVG